MKKSSKFIFQKYDTENLINRRAALVTIAKAGVFSVLVGRLAYLQIAENSNYKKLSDKNRITHRFLEPERGIIFDLQGRPMAINKQKYEIIIIKEETRDVEKSLVNLKSLLPHANIDIEKILKEVNSRKKFIPVGIIDDLTWEDFSKINVNIHKLEGIYPQIGFKRYYTQGESHSHLIGYVSPISKNEKESNPLSKLSTAKAGKIGVEKAKDSILRGKLGNKNIEVNASGREIRELDRVNSVQGNYIQLTIDSELQKFCYERLKGLSGSVSVINVKNGEFYALASSPSYDPNIFSKSISNETWENLLSDKYKPLINKSISNQYPPGSTIKPFVALAALESGVSHKETFFCDGKHLIEDTSLESGYKTFHCWKKEGHGNVDMTKAIKVSCDVYFYQIARRIGINKIAEVCKRYGLGEKVFKSLYEEKSGVVPNKQWKLENLGSRWMVGETLSAGIGQGYFLTTAAQLSLALAQLINNGTRLSPKLIYDNETSNIYDDRIIADPRYLKIIKNALDEATNAPGGTSYRSRIIGKYKMAGKTGTSQVRAISIKEREEGLIKNKDLPWEKRDHGLFIGYGPTTDPKYAVSVIVEHGGSGSGSAAPIASDVFKYLFEKKLNLKRNEIFNV